MDAICIISVILIAILVAFIVNKTHLVEGYRTPIYLNRDKYMYDYYPRANGSIYGPYSHLFSGYAYYDRAY